MFTIASTTANLVIVPAGFLLDHFGHRLVYAMGLVLFALATILFSLAHLYLPAFILTAAGGPFLLISVLKVLTVSGNNDNHDDDTRISEELAVEVSDSSIHGTGKRSSAHPWMIAAVNGCMDASSFLLYLLTLIARAVQANTSPSQKDDLLDNSNGLTAPNKNDIIDNSNGLVDAVFGVYGAIAVALGCLILCIMPKNSVNQSLNNGERPKETDCSNSSLKNGKGDSADCGSSSSSIHADCKDAAAQNDDASAPYTHSDALKQHRRRCTPVPASILLLLASTCLYTLLINFWINSFHDQVAASGITDAWLSNSFSLALPMLGILSVPVIGPALSHLSPPVTLGILHAMAVALCTLPLIPLNALLYPCGFLVAAIRPYAYTLLALFVGLAHPRAFGSVYGACVGLSGIVNLLQYPLIWAAKRAGSFVGVNAGMLGCVLVWGVVPVELYRRRQRSRDMTTI
ncbi:MAG: hypothetical protein SGCHY_004946 [Lobulomycetales sp.]